MARSKMQQAFRKKRHEMMFRRNDCNTLEARKSRLAPKAGSQSETPQSPDKAVERK